MIERRAHAMARETATALPGIEGRGHDAPAIYEHLDDLLLERINAGATVFPDIYSREVLHASDMIAAAQGACFTNMASGFRIVETRLQELKQAGRIDFRAGRGWRIVAPAGTSVAALACAA